MKFFIENRIDATLEKHVPARISFEDLPEEWVCSLCGASKQKL